MPYVAIRQIQNAIKSLQRFHPFFGVTFLSMKKTGVGTTTPTVWGTGQEDKLLNEAYSPPGAPAGKRFFVPFGRPEDETGFWRNPKYSGGALQSARTRQQFSEGLVRISRDQWQFADDYVAKFQGMLPEDGTGRALLPVFDLAAWIYRDKDLPPTLEEVEKKFRADFNLSDATEYAALFDATQPDAAQYFGTDPVSKEEIVSLTNGVPEGPTLNGRSEDDLIVHLETWMSTEADLSLPSGFVQTFYTALKAQRFVVLAGRPGTGKTAFVRAFYDALQVFFENAVQLVEVSVAQEFSEADVIGYEKISGGHAATELSRKVFLSGRPNDIYIVLLDEMNLAHVDHYLARLLPAFESDAHVELPGESSTKYLPADAMLVGTVNSFIEEPTRLPLSGPVKRRANVIEMPNFLAALVKNNQRDEFEKACLGLLKQTRQRVLKRERGGLGSVFDGFRAGSLDSAMKTGSTIRDLSLMNPLWEICGVCCAEDATALTFGVIQDILDYVAMSSTNIPKALSDQIAQKIVPQLNGPASVARELLALVERFDSDTGSFSSAIAAIQALLRTEDVGVGLVTYTY